MRAGSGASLSATGFNPQEHSYRQFSPETAELFGRSDRYLDARIDRRDRFLATRKTLPDIADFQAGSQVLDAGDSDRG